MKWSHFLYRTLYSNQIEYHKVLYNKYHRVCCPVPECETILQGDAAAVDLTVPSQRGGGSRGHDKNETKFVFRGDFKLPKELTPMPSVDGIFGADGVATSNNMGDVSCNGRGMGMATDEVEEAGVKMPRSAP